MKTAPRARRYYTTAQQLAGDNDGIFKLWYSPIKPHAIIPVIVQRDDRASREALVRKITKAWMKHTNMTTAVDLARATLAAIRK